MLDDNRRFVLAIAHALETHKTITGDDIDAIFRGTTGPTLDGWVYHTDEFLLSYEAYHLSTIEAHQAQAKPSRALPVIAAQPSGEGHATAGPPPGRPPVPGRRERDTLTRAWPMTSRSRPPSAGGCCTSSASPGRCSTARPSAPR